MFFSKQTTTEEVAQLFLDNRVRHKGFPWNIIIAVVVLNT